MTYLNTPAKEGLQIYRFHDKDYLNSPSITSYMINLEGFDYLSVLCSGAINPFVNFPSFNNVMTPEPDMFLQFSDKNKMWISEEIYNIPVKEKSWTKINFQPHSQGTSDFEGFYGDLYLICSKDPLSDWDISKDAPKISIVESEFEAQTTKKYWAGLVKQLAHTGLLPYVPSGYDKLSYIYYTEATLHSLAIKEYPNQTNDGVRTIVDISASGSASVDLMGTSRYGIEITNTDEDPKSFSLFAVWKRDYRI